MSVGDVPLFSSSNDVNQQILTTLQKQNQILQHMLDAQVELNALLTSIVDQIEIMDDDEEDERDFAGDDDGWNR